MIEMYARAGLEFSKVGALLKLPSHVSAERGKERDSEV